MDIPTLLIASTPPRPATGKPFQRCHAAAKRGLGKGEGAPGCASASSSCFVGQSILSRGLGTFSGAPVCGVGAEAEPEDLAEPSVGEHAPQYLRAYVQGCGMDEEGEESASAKQVDKYIEEIFSKHSISILNLVRDWVISLLPHCMSKINRVHFGLLHKDEQQAELLGEGAEDSGERRDSPRMLLAVPFLGKDVPSPASEFAHPDVLIGLSVLAYRYEGLRFDDVSRLLRHLKDRLSTEAGAYADRSSSRLYESWLHTEEAGRHPVLPLEVIQTEDTQQMTVLHEALRLRADVVDYYLSTVVFPTTTMHQRTKVRFLTRE